MTHSHRFIVNEIYQTFGRLIPLFEAEPRPASFVIGKAPVNSSQVMPAF
jgi:hypothetical protein